MGTLRGVSAALAACVVLSGCGAGQEDDQATTTSTAVTETPGNPWHLPIEQRPPLFDPCAEIPIEAVEQGVGGPVEKVDEFENRQTGELMSCGWANSELHFGVLSTWKSREDYLADRMFVIQDSNSEVEGRTGIRISERGDGSDSTCLQLFFTGKGTVWVSLDLVNALNEFKGARFTPACEALSEAILPVVNYIPEGDFR
ncbi:MAG: DUF3558 family protein [Dietzia sp.]